MFDLVPHGNCGYDTSALAVDGVGTLGFVALLATAAFAGLSLRQRARALAAAARTVGPGPAVLTGVLERVAADAPASDAPSPDALWDLRLDTGARVRLAPGAAADAPLVHGARVTLAGELVAGPAPSSRGEGAEAAANYRAASPAGLVLAPARAGASAAAPPALRVLPVSPAEQARARAEYHRRAARYIAWTALALHVALFGKYQALRFTGRTVEARVLERRVADSGPRRDGEPFTRDFVRVEVAHPAAGGPPRQAQAYTHGLDYHAERVPWVVAPAVFDQIGARPTVPWLSALGALVALLATARLYQVGARGAGSGAARTGKGPGAARGA